MKQFIKTELEPLILFLASIIVFSILSILGMVYNLGKSIYECFQLKFWKGIFKFIQYWLDVVYQIWNVVKYFLMKIAIGIDMFGNVAGGELVEDCVTAKEETRYGSGESTVSAATGELEFNGQLNKTGTWFTNLLSKVLGKGHSVKAYEKEVNNIK